jgi:hypothetical protein
VGRAGHGARAGDTGAGEAARSALDEERDGAAALCNDGPRRRRGSLSHTSGDGTPALSLHQRGHSISMARLAPLPRAYTCLVGPLFIATVGLFIAPRWATVWRVRGKPRSSGQMQRNSLVLLRNQRCAAEWGHPAV